VCHPNPMLTSNANAQSQTQYQIQIQILAPPCRVELTTGYESEGTLSSGAVMVDVRGSEGATGEVQVAAFMKVSRLLAAAWGWPARHLGLAARVRWGMVAA